MTSLDVLVAYLEFAHAVISDFRLWAPLLLVLVGLVGLVWGLRCRRSCGPGQGADTAGQCPDMDTDTADGGRSEGI